MPRNTSRSTTNQTGANTFANTATYGQIQPESNKYIDAFEQYRPQADPTIAYRAAAEKRRVNSSFLNPLGGYATPAMRDAITRSENRTIDQDAAMASRAGQYDVNQQRMSQLGSLAGLMAPRIVQTGSSGTGTSNMTGQSSGSAGQNLFGNILDLGLGAATGIF